MKKKKRNQFTNRPDSSAPALPEEMDNQSDFSASEIEVEIEIPSSDQAIEPAAAAVLDSAPVDDFDSAALEPMDELFNEMLAHESELAATEEAALSALPETITEVEPTQTDEAPSAADPAPLETDEAALLRALEDAELEAMIAAEEAAQSAQIAQSSVERVELPEPDLEIEDAPAFEVEEPAAMELAPPPPAPVEPSTQDVPYFLDSVQASEPEPVVEEAPPVPLGPQPALEAVVGSIDRALEAAPAVVSPAESSVQHHHQKQFSQLDDYVVFSLAGGDYAVPVRDVAEIGRVPAITRVPNVPEFVRGITNLRGEVVPVLNLPALLGLMESQVTARGRVLFLQARAEVSATGLLVDEVKGIQRIQSQQLEQVTGLVDDKVTSVLRGVYGRGDRLLNVLDLEQLFRLQEFRQLETV